MALRALQGPVSGTPVGGSGATNTIPRWTGATTLGDSIITQSGAAGLESITVSRASATNNALLVLSTPLGGAQQLFLRGGAVGQYFDFFRSETTGALHVQGNQTGFNNICLVPTSGNVGIGTASPGSIVDVLRTVNNTTNLQVRNLSATASAQARVDIVSDAGTLAAGMVSSAWTAFGLANGDGYIWNLANRSLSFGTNATERARIDPLGNFGIGTAGAPDARLHIPFDASNAGARIRWVTNPKLTFQNAESFYFRSLADAEQVIIDGPNKQLNVAQSTWGLKLPATPGNPDTQTLDCYQEGTWAPTLTGFGGTNPTVVARYTRVGRTVSVQVFLAATGGNQFSSTAGVTYLSLPSGMTPFVSAPGSSSDSGIGAGGPCVAYSNGNLYLPTFALRTADTFLNVTYTV